MGFWRPDSPDSYRGSWIADTGECFLLCNEKGNTVAKTAKSTSNAKTHRVLGVRFFIHKLTLF